MAATRQEIEARRKAFIRKWRLKHRAVVDSLEEAGDRLFTFTRLPPSQWRSARTTNAIERLHEEFKRRIKTQTVLPSADTRRCCSGRCSHRARSICARSMVGRRSQQNSSISQLTSLPEAIPSCYRRSRHAEFQPLPGRQLTVLIQGQSSPARCAGHCYYGLWRMRRGAFGRRRYRLQMVRGAKLGRSKAARPRRARSLGVHLNRDSSIVGGWGNLSSRGSYENSHINFCHRRRNADY